MDIRYMLTESIKYCGIKKDLCEYMGTIDCVLPVCKRFSNCFTITDEDED